MSNKQNRFKAGDNAFVIDLGKVKVLKEGEWSYEVCKDEPIPVGPSGLSLGMKRTIYFIKKEFVNEL